jgi:uncharacterized protein (DUF1499 family)
LRRHITAVVSGVAVVAVAAFLILSRWPLINVVETGRTPEYPDILPRRYEATVERVFDAALHAVNRLPRWSLRSYQPESGEIRAEARTRLFRYVDDIHIRVVSEGSATVVLVRSASRVGRGDFGQNARNIRALFNEIDRQMRIPPGHS